ncbi:hypothetical protein [Bacillus sp. KH172YL63]|uniref:hypothetical protein n=1 Tax=Bacillus sp. KH172YL63 TaxID=2709784 RepID=UPI0013E4681E|nr:hypothetical protein [Bacillus sp. KH172YL63]BCB05125.1 hypothetical protein KH172YL63_32580 [Bacillus sp. KH172YL63]
MEDKLSELKRAMDTTTHKGRHFTHIQRSRIRQAAHHPVTLKSPGPFLIFIMTTAAICLIAFFVSTEWLMNERQGALKKNEVEFSISPDPGLHAGATSGYIFHFEEPFDTFKGKALSIIAVHEKSGQRIEVQPPKKITDPSPGYSSLQRYTTSFAIPYSGKWRMEVYLDGKLYGDADLKVEDGILPADIPAYIKESDFLQINWDRKATEFGRNLIGNENKSGIIGADMPSLSGQKWMWHLWHTDASELTVAAYHRESGTVHPILHNGESWTIPLGGENNGADVHAPSSVTISEPGDWAFVIYADGELFDVIVLKIEK